MQTILHYDQKAEQLVSQYESLTFEHVHPALPTMLPPPGATILDIGAGSGRDAAWFAAKGYDVVAAEPSEAMRTLARQPVEYENTGSTMDFPSGHLPVPRDAPRAYIDGHLDSIRSIDEVFSFDRKYETPGIIYRLCELGLEFVPTTTEPPISITFPALMRY